MLSSVRYGSGSARSAVRCSATLSCSGRAAAGAHVRVPCVRTAEQLDEEEQGGGGRAGRGCRGPIGNL